MFYGTFQHKMNSKGQAAIPARFRLVAQQKEGVDVGFYLINPELGHLYLYTQQGMEAVVREVKQTAGEDDEFVTDFCAKIEPVDRDTQGRIVVPEHLRRAAGIAPGQEVVFVGGESRVELWSAERWGGRQQKQGTGYSRKLADVRRDVFRRTARPGGEERG